MKKRVALIGTSFRFPSTDTASYWPDLLAGKDLVTSVDASRWSRESFLHPGKSHPGTAYTFAAGSLGDVSGFDAGFFGISPREAAQMDPQQRLLLEMCWEAMENAGVKPSSLRGSDCGVFMGVASVDYSMRLSSDLAAIDSATATGTTSSIVSNRISYCFDLNGPSMSIDTACSSSLVAFHQACRAIQTGEISQALAGGISLHLHPFGFIIFSKASMLSRKGRCNVFDASGDGYVRSEGGGVFLLKDYDQAVADGNRILAIVAHSAVNTDGRKSGLTVPRAEAQADLLTQAYAQAGISPDDISYLEAHGTGTAVGDPLETRALGMALGQKRSKPLPIGSVKSNMGHLETASGVAGLVKALYSIQHRVVPATIGVKTLNPNIHFDEWNLTPVLENIELPAEGKIIIGVNSFGFGGANAHVILESPDETAQAKPARTAKIKALPLVFSAASASGLKAMAAAYADYLQEQAPSALYDIAYHAIHRRDWLTHRAVVWGSSPKTLAAALREYADGADHSPVETGVAPDAATPLAFVFSGNGSQWLGMGKNLLKEPVFRKAVQEVDAVFQKYANYSLEDELAGKNGPDRFEYTEIAQPALFAMQVGITELLRDHGIKPAAVTGHSVGEVASAWASGALSLETAVKVIFHRSRLQGTTKGNGQMTAVGLDAKTTLEMIEAKGLADSVCIAGVNSPKGVTLAGTSEGLGKLEVALRERGAPHKRLDLDYAFHSAAMDSTEGGIIEALSDVVAGASHTPYYSTVSGDVLPGESLGKEYWWYNIRKPVLFEDAIKNIIKSGIRTFVEIGPHAVLRGYLNDCLKDAGVEGRVIPTVLRDNDNPQRILAAASQVLIAGAKQDWEDLLPVVGQHVDLPNYAWQHEQYWQTPTPESLDLLARHKLHPLLGYRLTQQNLVWENQLDVQAQPMLADHMVGEAVVFPGAGYVELALAAARNWQTSSGQNNQGAAPAQTEIESLEIRAPLLLSEDASRTARVGIDAADGTVAINAREYAGSAPWTLHAVGRILQEPSDALLQQQRLLPEPTRQPDFNAHSHQITTRTVGLMYGPAFSAVDHGWILGDTVLARFNMPAEIEADFDQYLLHPAMLDCAFQLVVQFLREDIALTEGIAFIPTQMGRISFATGLGTPAWAQVKLLRRSPHSLLADFTLFDVDGNAIAYIKEARFRSVRLFKGKSDHIRHLDYQLVPKPLTMNIEPAFLPFEQVRVAVKEAVRRGVVKGTHRRYTEEIDPLLDELCSRFTLEALTELSGGDWQHFDEELTRLGNSNPQTAAFLSYLVASAEADGLLVRDNDSWKVAAGLDQSATAQDIWNALISDCPDYFEIIHAVGRIGMHLPGLISGKLEHARLLPAEASYASLGRQITGASARNYVGRALRKLVGDGLDQLKPGQRINVLEIGAEPGWALDVCAVLDFDRGDFCFASTAGDALDATLHLQERYPALRTQLIGDADSEDSNTYHLVVVSLDFRDPADSLRAMRHARARLAPGGSLIVIGNHPPRWLDFIFGGDAAWWTQTAEGERISRQQPLRAWQNQLEQLGFVETTLFEFSPDTNTATWMLVAQNPSKDIKPTKVLHATSRNWLLLADAEGKPAKFAAQLSRKLTEAGDHVSVVQPTDQAAIEAAILDAQAGFGKLDGIVHLSGLGAATAATAVEVETERCRIAADLLRACEVTGCGAATLWLITQAAMTQLLPGKSATVLKHAFADAALWGFGRTCINESAGNPVRLVDFADINNGYAEQCVNALYHEFELPDAEDEIVFGADVSRYATRLRTLSRPDGIPDDVQPQKVVHSLGFEMPGQLRNLRWEERAWQAPADDELEIEVRATGLNFRDVMYALGLLSDEAIENGFAGPTLGMEFAGIVTSAGSKTTGYSVGDLVVGFGSSSFSDRLVTKASAVAHIPPGISFSAAATIPSTFFTAYYALHHLAQLQEGEKVLIHGAAGGVGIAAIQIAKWCGAEIFATAGSDEKRDFLRLLGVDHILDSRSLAYADDIMEITEGKGIDVVLNSLAGEAINRNFRILKPFGRFLELGKRDFYENTKIGLRPFRNNITYFGIDADQLMSERPALTKKLFAEMMTLFNDRVLHPLPYHAFEAEDIVDAFRYMQQAKQIGKIIITYRNGISASYKRKTETRRDLALPAEATYLVTGGLGGFGLRTAEWLASKGAKNLVLLGRRGPTTDEAKEGIARLEAQGVKVLAKSCDITKRDQLAAVIKEASASLPPLKGIVHAAVVIEDGLIRNLDAAAIAKVFEPKILGAQYLHELTQNEKLDFFVMYSSATTLFGNPGQSAYVAANMWLEALARQRRAMGLPATCALWGAIDDAGFLARNEKIKEALQGRMGGAALTSAVALDALENLLLENRSGEGVLEVDWKALNRFLPSAAAPKFTKLAHQGGADDESDTDGIDIQRMLAEMTDAELVSTFIDMLKHQVGEILRVPVDKIDPTRSIYDMGLDSLMGVELVVAMESVFGTRLPVMALSESPTIAKLAERLIAQLRGNDAKDGEDTVARQIQQVAAQHSSEVSAEQLASLSQEINAGEAKRMIN